MLPKLRRLFKKNRLRLKYKLTPLLNTLKKKLLASPVKINDKPIVTWKLLLPLALIALIFLISLIVNHVNRPLTPDEIAQKTYRKAKENADSLGTKVAKQVDVPKDETPSIATVTDVNLLQDQEFFKQAKNGDKLLIYEKKKIVILYRPSEDKVIAQAPVLFNADKNTGGISSPSAVASGSAILNH